MTERPRAADDFAEIARRQCELREEGIAIPSLTEMLIGSDLLNDLLASGEWPQRRTYDWVPSSPEEIISDMLAGFGAMYGIQRRVIADGREPNPISGVPEETDDEFRARLLKIASSE
jgi:hypothetical protein